MPLRSRVRNALKGAVASTPLYRFLPPGRFRSYAALHYHGANSSPETVCQYVSQARGRATAFYSTLSIAARAAFDAGQDDLAGDLLSEAAGRFPEVAEVHLLSSELHAFHGDYPEALRHCSRARLLDPLSQAAAAREFWLCYLMGDEEKGDQLAIEATRRFPESLTVLWTASTECQSIEQFQRLSAVWEATLSGPRQYSTTVRPRAIAAARVGLLDTAVETYAKGMLLRMAGVGSMAPVDKRRLHGKESWTAIQDVREALDGAGIPFFFAAGTALGLVREGEPLGEDADIDVGVFEGHWDQGTLVEAFRKHVRFVPTNVHPLGEKLGFRHRGGSPVDVFRFYRENGRVWHNGTFIRWRNTPFEIQSRTIRSTELPLPENVDRYLKENYGDWRTPDPDFDAFTDAPNAEVTWPEYFDYYLVGRAYAHLASSDLRAAVRDLGRASSALRQTARGAELLEVLGV